MRAALLLAILLAGCGEDVVHVVGNVPAGEPAQPCMTDKDCSGFCLTGSCVDDVCTAPSLLPDGAPCTDGPTYSECKSGQCTLKPHDPEVCGEPVATEFPSVTTGKHVVICDACSNSCEEPNLSHVDCSEYEHESCCESDGPYCLSTCVGCCDGSAGGKAVLRCTRSAA